jgi:hypothetical protein
LAFVQGEDVADSATAVLVEGSGGFEKVEDCGEDLDGGYGGVD